MTFTVTPGQITGFVGPNGAGKSTTMRVLLGLDAADAGTALIGGRPYASLRRPLSQVGSLLDAGALQPGRSARNHLLWLAHSQGLGARRSPRLGCSPHRWRVLGAKAATVGTATLAGGAAAVLASVLAGAVLLSRHGIGPAHGYPALSLGSGPVLRAAVGSVLYLALIALLSLGVAAAVRDSAAAIGVVLALLFLFPIITSVIGNPAWQRHLDQISPMTAGLYIQATTNLRALPLTPWQGLGVLAAWATAAMLAGGLLLKFRDA